MNIDDNVTFEIAGEETPPLPERKISTGISGFEITLNKKQVFKTKDGGAWAFKESDLLNSVHIDANRIKKWAEGNYMYFGDGGYWRQISSIEMEKLISSLVRKHLYKLTKERISIGMAKIKQIIYAIDAETENYPDEDEIRDANMNGQYRVITKSTVINISPDGNYSTESNNGQYYNFIALDDFELNDKDDLNPEVAQFIRDIALGDEDMINYFQELSGHSMLHGFAPEPYIYILHGGGKNGKSVYIDMLKRIVNFRFASINYSEINPQNVAQLERVFVNLPSELDGGKTIQESLLKAITSGDSAMANEKYLAPRSVKPIAKQIGAANKLPPMTDSSEGLWRRIQVIPFRLRVKEGQKKDPVYFEQLFKDNASNIRNWAFKGLIRLLKQKGVHTKSNVIMQATSKYRKDENSVLQFVDEIYEELYEMDNRKERYLQKGNLTITFIQEMGDDTVYKLKAKELYSLYKVWANENGYHHVGIKNFKQKIEFEYIKWLESCQIKRIDAYAFDISFYESFKAEQAGQNPKQATLDFTSIDETKHLIPDDVNEEDITIIDDENHNRLKELMEEIEEIRGK